MFSYVLHGFFGYLLQLLPCTFFCIYPFYNEFRYKKKNVLAAMGAVLAVMASLFAYIYAAKYQPDMRNGYRTALTLLFLLSVIFLLAVYLFGIDALGVHKFFIFALILNYGFLLTESVSFLGSMFGGAYLYDTPYLAFHVLLNALLFYPMQGLLRRARHAFQSQISTDIWMRVALMPFLFFLGLLLFDEIPKNMGISDHQVLNLFTKAIEFTMFVLYYIILSILNRIQRLASERISLETAVENYKFAAAAAEKDREARHEFHHHITALHILLSNQDYAGAESYLEKISQATARSTAYTYTPHILLNAMLSEYEKRFAASQTSSEYAISVSTSLMIEDLDLCQFLSNLLDNALEANSHLPPELRRVSLTIRQTGNFLFFSCENPYDPARLSPTENGFDTSKSDAYSHGYGISIMKRIAEKYNGIFRIRIQDGIFIATANICTPPPKKINCNPQNSVVFC